MADWRMSAPLHPLLDWRAAQVEGAVALSVVVRSGPVRTAVNGTVVARPARTTVLTPGGDGSQVDPRARPVPGGQRRRWQAAKAARQPGRRNLRSSPPGHQPSPVGRWAKSISRTFVGRAWRGALQVTACAGWVPMRVREPEPAGSRQARQLRWHNARQVVRSGSPCPEER